MNLQDMLYNRKCTVEFDTLEEALKLATEVGGWIRENDKTVMWFSIENRSNAELAGAEPWSVFKYTE